MKETIGAAMHENPLRHPKSLVQVLPLLLPSEDDLRYWQSRLQELHSTSLPEREPFQTGTCVIELEAGLSFEEAQQEALKQGETVATLALLAVLKSLAEIQQDQKVVVGRVSSLRDRLEGGEEVPGPLLNTLPAAFDFASLNGLPIQEAVEIAGKQLREDLRHDTVSIRDVARSLGRGQLFDVLFDYQVETEALAPKAEASLDHVDEEEESGPLDSLDLQVSLASAHPPSVAIADDPCLLSTP